jgi:histone H3/H4
MLPKAVVKRLAEGLLKRPNVKTELPETAVPGMATASDSTAGAGKKQKPKKRVGPIFHADCVALWSEIGAMFVQMVGSEAQVAAEEAGRMVMRPADVSIALRNLEMDEYDCPDIVVPKKKTKSKVTRKRKQPDNSAVDSVEDRKAKQAALFAQAKTRRIEKLLRANKLRQLPHPSSSS